MVLKVLLRKIDQFFCAYIGLKNDTVKPATIQVIGEQLVIGNTTTFKRHELVESWEDFHATGIKKINAEDREKLGIAAGKAIAKKLIISFEEPTIKK